MNENDQQTKPSGRSFLVQSYGDNADEIELYALDKARAFFGSDVQLRVQRDYYVHTSLGADPRVRGDKTHQAAVTVFVVE